MTPLSFKQKLIKMLQIAKYAPSGGNLQPWKVYIINNNNNNINSIKLIITIDQEMEIGQYGDLGMFASNIKLLSPHFGLNCGNIKFISSISNQENIFCVIQIDNKLKSKINKAKL